jgi:hypothetical protein
MKINGKNSNNPLVIANFFNSYFSSVAENLIAINSSEKNTINKMNPMTWLRQNFSQPFTTLKLKNTTTHEIEKNIHSLKCKNSHGYDGISTRILKISAPYILSPLTYIFNKVLSTGIFLERLKFSEVNPIFKKGDKAEIFNYRPVSLLTSFSKVIEKINYKRLYNYLNENNVLVKEQDGFRKKLSTETAIHSLLNNILSALDRKNLVGGLFCDLQKVFDCVNH